MKLTGENRSTREKTCPSATLPTTNPTWTDPGSNPGLRGERPTSNRLSHDTALSKRDLSIWTRALIVTARSPHSVPPYFSSQQQSARFVGLEIYIRGGGGGLYEFCPELITTAQSGWSAA
jgi:hypothetical protein